MVTVWPNCEHSEIVFLIFEPSLIWKTNTDDKILIVCIIFCCVFFVHTSWWFDIWFCTVRILLKGDRTHLIYFMTLCVAAGLPVALYGKGDWNNVFPLVKLIQSGSPWWGGIDMRGPCNMPCVCGQRVDSLLLFGRGCMSTCLDACFIFLFFGTQQCNWIGSTSR